MTVSRMIRCINGHVFDATVQAACPNCGWTEKGKVTNGGSAPSNGSGSENGSANLLPSPNRNLIMIGVASVAVITVGALSYAFFKQAPVPVPDPIVKVPDKKAEKTTEKLVEKTPEIVLEKVPEKLPGKLPEKTTEVVANKIPEKAPDSDVKKEPEIVPEKIPDKAIEKQPEPRPVIKVDPPVSQVTNGLIKFDALEPLTQDTQISAATALGLSPFATELALLIRATKLAERQPSQLQAQRLLVPFVKSNQPMAMADAASSSYYGYAVAVDDKVALDYFTKAAEQGSVRARAELAQLLLAGRAMPRDPKAAADYFVLAARADSPFFEQILLGLKALNVSLDGKGPTAGDLQKAFSSSNWELSLKLAHELADLKIAKGYHVLGMLSWSGNAVPKDQAAAIDWFKKASAIGYSPATESLSYIAKTPASGSGNLVEAVVLLEIAYLQSENKQRAIYFSDKISEQAGLLDHGQWAAIKTLFADITIPGPG